MAHKARVLAPILLFALILQGCMPVTVGPDIGATVAVYIQQTLTAQSIQTTATSLVNSPSTSQAASTPAVPGKIPRTGGSADNTPPNPVTATGVVLLDVHQPTNCRSGPGLSYDLLASLFPNISYAVVGYDIELNYWIVTNPNAEGTCWIWGGYGTVQGDVAALPTMVPPPAPAMPRITVSADTRCRSGPGLQYTVLGGLAANATVDLVGRLSSSNWWLIANPNGAGNCWVPGDGAAISGNIQALPFLEPPPGATAAPTSTTSTAAPTSTPMPEPTATLDLSAYQCKIVSQSVRDGTIFQPKANFDGTWVLENTGSEPWEPDSVSYVYVNGTQMSKYKPAYPLQKVVEPGKRVRIIIDMRAPQQAGGYVTLWGLAVDGNTFCPMQLSIYVSNP